MKQVKYFNFLLMMCLSMTICSQYSIAQKNTTDKNNSKREAVKNMLDSQHFTFVAQSVTPLRAPFRILTSLYEVDISNDTMVCYLPYFGRAYSPPLNSSQGPLDFTSSDFSYSVAPHKKNGWDVVIKPRDNSSIQQFQFTVYDNASASLNVIGTSRDPISFNGRLKKREKK